MSFPIPLQGKDKTGNFTDICLLFLNHFLLICLPDPIITYNVDGTKNQKETICWKAKTILTLEDHSDPIKLMMLRLSKPRVILGMPWLKKWNPKIDWNCLSMTLPSSPRHHIPYHACYLGRDTDHELSQLFSSQSPAENDWSLHEYHLLAEGSTEQINKITISIPLTQADKPKEIPIPNFCTDFSDIFSKKTYDILPPHHSFDHTIKLRDSFIPKIMKVYPLNLAKKEACKAFIDKHLKTGQIVPSKSPQATPFFFVPKKDGTLCVMVEEVPTLFSPFSLVNCMLLLHFSFNDFITVAFLDLARGLNTQF